MKQKNLFLAYIGILAGTVIANFYMNDRMFLLQDYVAKSDMGLLTLMIRRSVEIIFLVYIGMVINKKVWEVIIDFLSGTILGVLTSIKTMLDGLFPTILYFLIVLIIVSLYNIDLKLTMTESQGRQENANTKLHNSFFNKFIIFAIIFVNSILEIIVLKIF